MRRIAAPLLLLAAAAAMLSERPKFTGWDEKSGSNGLKATWRTTKIPLCVVFSVIGSHVARPKEASEKGRDDGVLGTLTWCRSDDPWSFQTDCTGDLV
jgi:hypothetical protein